MISTKTASHHNRVNKHPRTFSLTDAYAERHGALRGAWLALVCRDALLYYVLARLNVVSVRGLF